MNAVKNKLKSQTGESITETLVALLISALALTMLAGAVGATERIIQSSEKKMEKYYKANNTAIEQTAQKKGTDGTISLTLTDGSGNSKATVLPGGTEAGITVKYNSNNEFHNNTVVMYALK